MASENLLNRKTELSSEEKFKLLVLDVPYNSAVAQAPLVPDRSQNVLVDKGEAGVDWLHTTVGSWRNKSTNMRVFRRNECTDTGWVHRKLSLAEYKTVSGDGYILKTQYSHHNSEKYASVKRHSTEVLKLFPGKPPEPTTYGLIHYTFPSIVSSISPQKKKRHNVSCTINHTNTNTVTVDDNDTISIVLEEPSNNEKRRRNVSVNENTQSHEDVTSGSFPPFNLSGLPAIYQSSWENAGKIIDMDLIKKHPLSETIMIVGSLSSDLFHNVKYYNNKYQCDCEGFKFRMVCAHVIAVVFKKNFLEKWLVDIEFPKLQNTSTNKTAGKKPGYVPRVRKNIKRGIQEVEGTNEHEDEKFNVGFISGTSASKCYGCTGRLRVFGNEPAPPPFDIVLQSKTFRHYREKATKLNPGKLHIKTKKENVYFHPQLACLNEEKQDVVRRMVVSDDVNKRLQLCHKNLLFTEFGYTFIE